MDKRGSPQKTPALEWIAAGVGLALLLVVFGVIGQDAIRHGPADPPSIAIDMRRIVPISNGFLVQFDAVNSGGSTAAGVEVRGELSSPAGQESASATLDYVSGGGRTPGGLFFTSNPRNGTLRLRAGGYQEP